MSHLEAIIRQREGIRETVRAPKPSNWTRVDRELDEIERRIDALTEALRKPHQQSP
jgi:hypothetical protein